MKRWHTPKHVARVCFLAPQVAGGTDGSLLRDADVVLTTYSTIENEFRR